MGTGDWILMGVAGWIIASVGLWATVHNNGDTIRIAGGASWASPGVRRLCGIVLILFGASLILGSILRWNW